MKNLKKFAAVVIVGFLGANATHAQTDLDKLVEQTGIEAGEVAMRDLPNWRSPKKILVHGGFDIDDDLQGVVPGIQFIKATSESDAIAKATDVDAIIGRCSNNLVNAAAHATWVQVTSAGVERCMTTERIMNGDVILSNMQKMSSPEIGEHAIAMMLSLTRGLVHHTRIMPDGAWNRSVGSEIGMMSVDGKTVLVVGLGGIGTAAAKRASVLGMRVLATRNSSRSGPDYVDYVGLSGELHELAAQADVVINALPLTAATEGIFDDAFFDAAKPGVFFINVARGRSVVTDDLVAALQDGRVAGAGLDVTNPEPLPPDHPLWQIPNVVITPHIAWYGGDGERQRTLERENIRRFIAGDALLNVVDPAQGY